MKLSTLAVLVVAAGSLAYLVKKYQDSKPPLIRASMYGSLGDPLPQDGVKTWYL